MISTLIFTNIATAYPSCPSFGSETSCMDYYPTCDWYGECGTSPYSQCHDLDYDQCLSTAHMNKCEWSLSTGKCGAKGCGWQSCESECNDPDRSPGCSWQQYCGYQEDGANQQKKRGEAQCNSHRRVDEDASGDVVEPDNTSGDVDEPEDTEGRRRITHNDAYCRKYSRESQCNIDSVCTWQQGWWSGSCVGKIVTGCQSHEQWDCASCTGNNGYPCNWVGTSQVGSCVEQTSPSPSPSGTCGMFYRQDSCPANCQWSYWKNECVEKVSPSPSPSTCGMFYSETSCPANCHWSYMQNKCVSGSNTGDCSQYGSFWPCSSTQGCKWNVIQNTCSSSGSHPIFCDTLMSESWCRMFESECTWSSYHNQCLARGN